jgi:hypothetical protein
MLPWRAMERELARKLAAKAARSALVSRAEIDERYVDLEQGAAPWRRETRDEGEVERAPVSGVRESIIDPLDEPHRALSYSVYTVADLEARGAIRPPRMSIAFAPPPPVVPSPWVDVRKAALEVLQALWVCLRTPKPRPRLMDVTRVPLLKLVAELRVALAQLPWKKIGIGSAIAFGSSLVLLFIVVGIAELTDDLKPARTYSATSTMAASPRPPAPAAASPQAASPVVEPAAKLAQGGQVAAVAIELDDVPAVAERAKPAKAKKSSSKKAKPVEVFNP